LVFGASFDGDLLGDAGGSLGGRLELSLPIAVDLLDRGGGREATLIDPVGKVCGKITVGNPVCGKQLSRFERLDF